MNSVEMTLEKPATQALAAYKEPTVMQILANAVMRDDIKIDVVERLMAMQRTMAKDQAEQDFNDAMNRCQKLMKRIGADMENPQTHSRYASYAQLDRAIRPIYTNEGMALSFCDADSLTPDTVRVICYATRGGFTRPYYKTMPIVTVGPQGKAVMTPTHATASAGSYAKRHLLKDIFNLAIGEDDDDGNGAGGDLPEQDYISILDNISNASIEELKGIYIAGYKAAVEANDKTAMAGIIAAKDKRKAELQEAA